MQEEVEHKTITLLINAGKLTSRELKNAIEKYLNSFMQKSAHKDITPHGKQSVKKLVGQGQGVSNIEITDKNIKGFDRVARKYGVDYALKKDTSGEKPKYLVFFKAKDADALTSAFKEYSGKAVKRDKKPSVLATLRRLKALLKDTPKREKQKERER